uniref:uncharacterized protein LOC100181522 isoform X2 n=1 Tax=Ciona intestinalis TaxID=7719 RepID=UPI0005212178|nr:uncharacterized protein LOC100181522 isoform X2 [Ciona intestinalis]|eukprot:XP_009860525.1 uncharacterized protein LOC100181522 isoform X2 [Ciona intestinalis]
MTKTNMPASGIELTEEAKQVCKKVFKEQIKGCRLMIKDEKCIIVEEGSIINNDQTFENILEGFKRENFRYAVVNIGFTKADSVRASKMLVLKWAPDDGPRGGRTVTALSWRGLIKSLDACIPVSMSDSADKCVDTVIQKLYSNEKVEIVEFEGRKLVKEDGVYEYKR